MSQERTPLFFGTLLDRSLVHIADTVNQNIDAVEVLEIRLDSGTISRVKTPYHHRAGQCVQQCFVKITGRRRLRHQR